MWEHTQQKKSEREKVKEKKAGMVFIVIRLNEDGITNHYIFFVEIYIGYEFMRTNV